MDASEGQRFCSGTAENWPYDFKEDQVGDSEIERVDVERAFGQRKT